MLVLARKLDEVVVIKIPDRKDIRVMVTDITRKTARLGFEADEDIVILREEIWLLYLV